jgi:uncharacterized membrane protein
VKKTVYIVLCVLGTLIPYAVFAPFLVENGLDLQLFVKEMFATQVAAFFSADMLVASLALWAFIFFEVRARPIQNWWLAILANLVVGVSLALPLFLLLRELSKEPEKRKRHVKRTE